MTIDRWSYDPRTNKIDVWDSENNRIQHYDRTGQDGYVYCAQGRILDDDEASIYGNRPIKDEVETDYAGILSPDEIRVRGQKALEGILARKFEWVEVF